MPKPTLFPESYSLDKFNPRSRVDPSRIEGYSEIVQANDIAKADPLRFGEAHRTAKVIRSQEDAYKVIGARPQELPVEFAWLRVSGPAGATSASADAEIDAYTANQGYIPCTKERFDQLASLYGYKFNDVLWHVAEDGTIRRGADSALFFRSGEVARMWERHQAESTAKAEGSSLPTSLAAGKEKVPTFSEEESEEIFITH